MSDNQYLRVRPVMGAGSAQSVRADQVPVQVAEPTPEPSPQATTGGTLRAAYAQFVVDSSSQDVVVRIRDASTDEILSELPSKEVQAVSKHLREYAEMLARRRAALASGSGN